MSNRVVQTSSVPVQHTGETGGLASTRIRTRTGQRDCAPEGHAVVPQERRQAPTVVGTRPTAQLLTQNLQGFAKTTASLTSWFDGLRRPHDRQAFDLILVQETRATMHWAPKLEELYARGWGYDPRKLKEPLSYWVTTPQAAAGVGMLLHPGSAFTVTAWRQSDWSGHFMALRGLLHGKPTTIVAIYGPTCRAAREKLFSTLATYRPPNGMLLVGGDFNCTTDPELDRSRPTKRSHSSETILDLLAAWQLVDAVCDEMVSAETSTQVTDFRATYHTYRYGLQDGSAASARLDRWYVSMAHYAHVGRVETVAPVAQSDRDGVALRLHTDPPVVSHKKRQKRGLKYPLPPCAADAVHAACRELIAEASPRLLAMSARDSARAWDPFKGHLLRTGLRVLRERLTVSTVTHRSQVKRVARQLRELKVILASAGATRVVFEQYKSAQRNMTALKMRGTARSARARAASNAPSYRRIRLRRSPPPTALQPRVKPIHQQPAADADEQDVFFASLPAKMTQPDYAAVGGDVSEAAMRAAFKACPRGKTSGPDGLSNDWYRAMEDELVGLLATLFSRWYDAGVLPPSFREASIFCIPKISNPRSGLDFRPIALLNTDYTLFARVLLEQLRGCVSGMVAQAQYDFVPGRQVHDAVDVWTALQLRADRAALPAGAFAILLDFAKAYDTLDRRFLSKALECQGVPVKFVRAVEAMHLATAAAFLVGGYVSAAHEVTTGIRQGCPFAPTLFIIAVDVLYDLFESNTALTGLQLDESTTVKLVGFADDTTAYLSSPTEAPALLEALDRFGKVSGLRVNVYKSTALCFREVDRSSAHEQCGIPLAQPAQLVRYLGVQISTLPNPRQVWDVCLQQLRAKLHLAAVKTTDLLQRVQICRVVIMPKLLFTARHALPDALCVARLQRFVHNYAWRGVLSDSGGLGRAWMGADQAGKPISEGGLHLPQVRESLLILGAKTLKRWLAAMTEIAAAVGRILTGCAPDTTAIVAIGRGHTITPRLCRSLASTGRSVVQAITAAPFADEETQLMSRLLVNAGRAPLSCGWWQDGWYQRDYGLLHDQLAAVRAVQRDLHGHFNAQSLQHARILGDGVLLGPAGIPLLQGDLPGLVIGRARISELIEFERVGPDRLRFRLKGHVYPYRAADSFRTLCDILVMCYPNLLLPQDPVNHLTPRQSSRSVWSLRRDGQALHLMRSQRPHDLEDLGPVVSHRHATAVARRATGSRKLTFAPHPALGPLLPIWGPADPVNQTALNDCVYAARSDRAAQAESQRVGSLGDDRPAAALDRISWAEVHGLRASISRQRLLFHRIKGRHLSGWDRSSNSRGCPHCPAAGGAGSTIAHIMWYYPAAQSLWAVIRDWWESLGLRFGDNVGSEAFFLTAVFSLRLPRVPPKVWDLPSLRFRQPDQPDGLEGPFPILNVTWQQQVLDTLVVIWSWRNGMADAAQAWSAAQARVIHASACHRVLDAIRNSAFTSDDPALGNARLLADLLAIRGDADDAPPVPPATYQGTYVLLFDGGSRGNLGPGGAGAVVVVVRASSTGTATLKWRAAVSLPAASTTNNVAEYTGVVSGLRAAFANSCSPLEVVGDSALILGQLRCYRPPKRSTLRPLYDEARRLADTLGVIHWHHHFRTHNKMADRVANHAMDSLASSQVYYPTSHQVDLELASLLANDLQPWFATGLP